MALLFHDGLVVVTVASGSKGNCTYVGDGQRGVLVDCGVSTKQILGRLEAVGLGDAPIDAVLVTHEHTDHVGAAAVLDRKLEKRDGRIVPYYMTEATHRALRPSLRPREIVHVTPGTRLPWSGWTLEAHSVPHDVDEPVAWAVEAHGVRAGVITDLGHPTRLVARLLASLDVAVVEFNHDLQLLHDGPYPWPLKQRIRSRHGHLSNPDAARLVRHATTPRLRHLILGHLSETNNTPDHAMESALAALRDGGHGHVDVHLGRQDRACDPLRVGAPVHAVRTPAAATRPARPTQEPAAVQPSLFDAPDA